MFCQRVDKFLQRPKQKKKELKSSSIKKYCTIAKENCRVFFTCHTKMVIITLSLRLRLVIIGYV